MKRSSAWAVVPAILAISVLGCAPAKKDQGGSTAQMPSGGGPGATAANPGTNGGSGGATSAGGDGSANPAASGSGGSGSGTKGGGGTSGSKGGGSSGTSGSTAGSGASGSGAMQAQEMLDPGVDWTALTLVFPEMYSAYDGQHTFMIPAHVDMATVDLKNWEAIPSDAVTFDPDPDVSGGVMITIVKGVEEITIAAHADKLGGTAKLHVTLATPDDWNVGQMRYNNGVDYMLPDFTFASVDRSELDAAAHAQEPGLQQLPQHGRQVLRDPAHADADRQSFR